MLENPGSYEGNKRVMLVNRLEKLQFGNLACGRVAKKGVKKKKRKQTQMFRLTKKESTVATWLAAFLLGTWGKIAENLENMQEMLANKPD